MSAAVGGVAGALASKILPMAEQATPYIFMLTIMGMDFMKMYFMVSLFERMALLFGGE